MFDWDIDRFPLKTATPTPGQRAADKWLAEHPDQEMREVQPGDLDRLTREHQDDPRDQNFGVPTSGYGLGGGGIHYDTPGGYNQPDRSYPSNPGDPGHQEQAEHGAGGHYIPWRTRPFDPGEYEEDDDEEYEREPVDYHVVTRPRGAIPGLNAFNEHEYTMFEHPDHDTDPEAAWTSFEEDHPDHDVERYPDTATHEVVHVHPAEQHDQWHNGLRSEEEAFSRIAPHGFERESPDVIGHKAYRHEEPNGVVHRIWHNDYSFNGPGWHTSRYDPTIDREHQPVSWSEHPDNASGDSLGDALEQARRNLARG